jgi:S-DNA-T family DNA segregation ATPase FtsK/SpoIIIE
MTKDSLNEATYKILCRLLGITLIITSTAFLVAIMSHDSNDISYNFSSTKYQVNNILGQFGANMSDILLQFLGLSALCFVLIFFIIGFKMVKNAAINRLYLKLFLSITLITSSALFFSVCQKYITSFTSAGAGGFLGNLFNKELLYVDNIYKIIASIFLAAISIYFIAEINFKKLVSKINIGKEKELISIYRLKAKLAEIIVKIKTLIFQIKRKPKENNINNQSKIEEKEIKVYDGTSNIAQTITIDREGRKAKPLSRKKLTNQSEYKLPTADLLQNRAKTMENFKINKSSLKTSSKNLLKIMEDYSVHGNITEVKVGPVVTLYEFEPAAGIKTARVVGLSDDISRSMSAVSARIAPISGKTTIGIELPNKDRQTIYFREMLESQEYKNNQFSLPMILGKNIGGSPVIVDLATMPHLLIAGTTGSGKSVGVNAMILSLLYRLTPEECRFIMIDPKMLELSIYNDIPHLLSPVVTDPKKAVITLRWVVREMEERYKLLAAINVRNIGGYNEKIEDAIKNKKTLSRVSQTGIDQETGEITMEDVEIELKKLPFIVVVVDEMADLMLVAGKDIEVSIQRLAQMARAAGIHIIMATQRPSVDVITGIIKANFPTRISFQVTSRIDSRTILGVQGAEQLLGKGDMIYMSGGSKMTRVHGPFCSDEEAEGVVNFIKNQGYKCDYQLSFADIEEKDISFSQPSAAETGNKDDYLYQKAVQVVLRDKKTSISYVQRQLRIGYNKSANLIEKMEQEGILSSPNSTGKREIIE